MAANGRAELEKLRDGLWEAFDLAKPEVKAQVAGQLRAVIKDLAALGEPAEVSVADDIAAKRAARLANPGGAPQTARRGQSRRSGGGNRAS